MHKYEKIETLFQRSTDGRKELDYGVWRNPTVRMLKDIPWDWTEKVDGTNIRVYWNAGVARTKT